ncbi:helix-turn-helix domain-containing protein [Flavobacterium sp. J27]|uniref:helix-turn-helix domain-containing protein n=1 Tax=Flavobacterium sp. J27 TaxID=2060419 RepID=UPI0010301C70|nr:helix-turn-helix domain-containing protein [Flavobacterium sp. J27]
MNRVKFLREQQKMTQTELAEQSGVSLRTIQRIEAGSSLKGFSLKAIAHALKTEPKNLLFSSKVIKNTIQAKAINLSVLSGLIIPFGEIIFPLILTAKTKDPKVKSIGKEIIEVQVLLNAFFSIMFLLSPFVQHYLLPRVPVFLFFLVLFLVLKIVFVVLNGKSLNQNEELTIRFKNSYL